MSKQKPSLPSRSFTGVLKIAIPSFLVLVAIAAGLLFFHPHTPIDRLSGLSLKDDHAGTKAGNQVISAQSGLKTMSGGSCWSYHTSSPDATAVTTDGTGTLTRYGFDGSDGPSLALGYNYCNNTIQVTIDPSGYDYYKIDWWRPGRDGWSQFTTGNSIEYFTNAHYGTYYEFTVDSCTSHWYGDSCTSWSPRVYIDTNV